MGLRRALFIVCIFSAAIFAATSAIPSGVWAGTVSLAWDPNPAAEEVTAYTVREGTSVVWGPKPGTAATLEGVAPGVHTYTLTASNSWGESSPSSPVSTPPAPSVPGGLRVTVTVDVTIRQ